MNLGACLCGAVGYEVDGPFENLMHCHCSMCRKHHGAPFASFVGASSKGFRWRQGEDAVRRYASSPSSVRGFCGTCGSVTPTLMGDAVYLPAGNLAGDLGDAGGMHIFVASKAPWFTIGDALPKHDAVPPGWPMPDVQRPAAPVLDGATHGSCLCGDVTFSVQGTPPRWFQCHCSRCRRGRSAAHGSNAFYPHAQFAWRSGRERVRSYKLPESERFVVSFCDRCGGSTPVEREGVPFVLVPMALLDGDPGARPQAHIHVASRASWYTAHDDLPKYDALPTG